MKRSRAILPVVLLLAVGGLLALADVPPTPGIQGPASLPELERDLGETTKRLERLVECAGEDPRSRLIDTYEQYSVEQFADPKRPVEAEHILEIMIADDAPDGLRKDAFGALTSKEATQFDPDLVLMGRGSRKPRASWCKSKVTKLLKDKKPKTRAFAHELLKIYFKGHARAAPVVMYDPYNGSTRDWQKAIRYWNKILLK